jgi:gliding motility-associated-like protein
MKKVIFTIALIGGVVLASQAQSFFNARLRVNKIDCNARTAQIDLEIRSLSAEDQFFMGDANLRFGYDATVMRRPVLKQQHNFSAEAAEGQDYGPQNLNGSSEGATRGVVSVNLFYTGTGKKPQKVTFNWMPIATIEFDLATLGTSSTTLVSWYTSYDFPKTGLSQVVVKNNNFDLKQVNGGQFVNASLPALSDACMTAATTPPTTTTPPTSNTNPVTTTPTNPVSTPPSSLVTMTPPKGDAPGTGTPPAGTTMPPNTGTEKPLDPVVIVQPDPTNTSDFTIPEGFSPNGDNINDAFVVKNGKGIKFSLEIFNRYGGLMYSNSDYRNDWKGTNPDGQDLPAGTYFYVIKTAEGKSYSKFLTLVR